MLPKTLGILTLLVALVTGCTDSPSENIDAEPALAVLGGAILGTQGTGIIARQAPAKLRFEKFLDALNPISEAFALPTACPDMTTGTCTGHTLSYLMQNCGDSTLPRFGLWHTYVSYTFTTPGDCANALAGGFDATTLLGLVGKTIVRDWGEGPAGDENNIRVGQDGTFAYMYGSFPSGWQEDRVGGVEITFVSTTQRRMVVKGVHALGIQHSDYPITDTTTFDLKAIPTDGESIRKIWDHSIHSIQVGDPLFAIGPQINYSGSAISYTGLQNDPTATFNGDINVNGTTVAVGATLRVQHNISRSIGVMSVITALDYSDPTCCWPMSGAVHVEYDRNYKAPTLEEDIVFTGASCGAIDYTTTTQSHVSKTLSQCF